MAKTMTREIATVQANWTPSITEMMYLRNTDFQITQSALLTKNYVDVLLVLSNAAHDEEGREGLPRNGVEQGMVSGGSVTNISLRKGMHETLTGTTPTSVPLAPGYEGAKGEPVMLACSAWIVQGLRRFRQISSSPVRDHGPGVVTSPPGWKELLSKGPKGAQGRAAVGLGHAA